MLNHTNIPRPQVEFPFERVEQDASYSPIMYEELPQVFRNELDTMAGHLLDLDQGHLVIVGTPQSGKTFLLNQLVGNMDRYTQRLGQGNMHFVKMDMDTLEQVFALEQRYQDYINALTEHLHCQERNICFVTEDVAVAAKLFTISRKSRILLETNYSNFMGLQQAEQQGTTKIWSSWEFVDPMSLPLKRTELVNLLYLALHDRLQETFNIDLTRKTITSFVGYVLSQVPGLVYQDQAQRGLIAAPIGVWMVALRRLGGMMGLSESPEFRNRNQEMVTSRVIRSAFEDNREMMEFFVPDDDTEMQNIIIQGPGGERVQLAVPADMLAPMGASPHRHSTTLEPLEFTDMDTLGDALASEVIGQEAAIQELLNGLVVSMAGLNDRTKPLRSLLFLGPTGVGKTKMALTLAENIATEPFNVVRIDMSEYGEAHEAAKLLGAPPGYVGSDMGGVLTNAVREHPRSVVLLDEVEKAHPRIWNSFLQILDAGRMTDGQGTVVDFTQCIIIMTSNIGAEKAQAPMLGFSGMDDQATRDQHHREARSIVTKAVENTFAPELVNRLDEMVVFNQISPETALLIVDKEVGILANRMAENGYTLETLNSDIRQELLAKSNVAKYGAREIQRVVLKNISNPVARSIVRRGKDSSKAVVLALDSNTKAISVREG